MPVETKERPVKAKEKPKKWAINQDDYLELLEMVDKNAKAILILRKDTDRLKSRLGI